MSGEITMALIAVVAALISPALVADNSIRGSTYTHQFAQYCMPQFDELSDVTRLYC